MLAVSIVVPAYNVASVISRAIESVLDQTFTDFEVVIVDDGSRDDTASVVKQFQSDSRIRYVYQSNKGLPGARNTGIQNSEAELIAFLDADDWWLPTKLEVQVRAMERNPDAGGCFVGATLVFPDGRQERTSSSSRWAKETMYTRLLFGPAVTGSGSSMTIRKKCFDIVGTFDESMKALEDRDMWLRLAAQFPIIAIDNPLVFIARAGPDNMTSDGRRMARGAEILQQNIERDMPQQHRHLLPRVSRHSYLRIATDYLSVGEHLLCWKFCIKALTAYPRPDGDLVRAGKLFLRSLVPSRFRWWYRRKFRNAELAESRTDGPA
jgi:glycosyltransferase involved in cell wall biosynthesis